MLSCLLLVGGCDRSESLRVRDPVPAATERATLDVTVVDDAGAPVSGWVTLSPGGRDRPIDGGVATFEGLVPGPYEVIAAAPGGATGTSSVVVDLDLSVEVRIDPLPDLPAVSGTARGPDDTPLVGATVWLDGAPVATTAADGSFAGGEPLEGLRRVEITPSIRDAQLLEWVHEAVRFPSDGTVSVDVVLAGSPPATASPIGSGPCGSCHAEIAGRFAQTDHARAGRLPGEVEGEPVSDAFLAGPTTVPLDEAGLPGATVTLGRDAPGSWWIVVVDALGTTSGALPVTHVYGGHRAGAALAVELDGVWTTAPVAWAAAGAGLSSQQHDPGWIAAWTTGWFDATGRLAVGPEASFDLQCAGCHATGHELEESGGTFTLTEATSTAVLERTVGCEACHGAGSAHRRDLDVTTILDPARLQASRRLDVCARCHERTTSDTHPFSHDPGWPVRADGTALTPTDRISDHATATPDWWTQARSSRVLADQVAELRASPHRQGPQGWDGSCSDCHDPHGTANPADLHTVDNTLCTGCHASRFPSLDDEASHAAHTRFEPGPWSPGACTSCHLPRSGLVVRRDAVTSVGEDHGHQLEAWLPADALAEFDLLGLDQLSPSEVPIGPCLDCHMNVDADRRESGASCPCPRGDLGSRVTYDNLVGIVDDLWGGP